MESVCLLVGSISAKSIPVELAIVLAEETDTDVTVVAFYDTEPPDDVPGIDEVDTVTLGADSRFDPRAFRKLFSVLRSESTALLHTHDNFLGSAGRVLGALAGVPIVDTEHRAHDSMSRLQNAVNIPTLPLSEVVAANSQATLDSFSCIERVLLSETPTRVVHNGVDVAQVEQATPAAFDTSPVVVCPARFVPVKNHEVLLEAFSEVLSTHPDAMLVLPGDGPRRQPMESYVATHEMSESVRFPGVVSRERVYEFYAGADAAVFTSHAEGFCVAAVEAMAAGLPVVASDIPVFHEVLGEAARFADHTDPPAVARALDAVLTDGQLATGLAETGSARAAERFPIDKAARSYAALYRQVTDTE